MNDDISEWPLKMAHYGTYRDGKEHALPQKRLRQWMVGDQEAGSYDEAEFKVLAIRIAEFERRAFPIPRASADELAEFRRLHLKVASK